MTSNITKYRFYKDSESDRMTCVQPYANNEWLPKLIPIDDKNIDYQYYLEWVSNGGVAEAAS